MCASGTYLFHRVVFVPVVPRTSRFVLPCPPACVCLARLASFPSMTFVYNFLLLQGETDGTTSSMLFIWKRAQRRELTQWHAQWHPTVVD